MDWSKLNDEQLSVALKVVEAAKKHGINPDFVLPIVQVESNFQPKAKSPAGAFGPMQLMPDTAKSLNVDPADVDQNIDGGMRFLKKLISNEKLENDPAKILAAYNAGPNSKFFSTNNPNDLPNETVNYVVKIFDRFGGTAPSMTIAASGDQPATEQPVSERREEPRPEQETARSENPYGSDTIVKAEEKPKKASDDDFTEKKIAAGLGALIGGGAGTIYETHAPVFRFARRILGRPVSGKEAAEIVEAATSAPSVAATPSGAAAARAAGAAIPGVTPMGGRGTYNYGKAFGLTDIEAQRALDMTKGEQGAHGLISRRSEGINRLRELFPTETWSENPRYGGILTISGEGGGPRESYRQVRHVPPASVVSQAGLTPETAPHTVSMRPLPVPERIPATQPTGGLPVIPQEQAPSTISKFLGSGPVRGALAGAGIGFNLEDFFQNYKKFKEDEQKLNALAALSNVGGAGASALGLVPKYAGKAIPVAGALTSGSDVMSNIAEAKRLQAKGMGESAERKKMEAAGSGLLGLAGLIPRVFGPLGAVLYSPSLNENEEEYVRNLRRKALEAAAGP